ncbi:MT-A70 family methyltransferase [Mycobacteroides abscessus]|uniref:MT-A70 family methyltransferase n=1 Tax=Mycobacteroides abscessus TaxID=36809 RepID=UPI0012FFD333|nr:MT-A70 family methyltransferase [Mycobacteroides abscessus]
MSLPDTPGGFRCVVADPPWQFDYTKSRGAAENHYGTMTVKQLCELSVVRDSAARDAHLYLWSTNSHLREAFDVMEAWGFEYKTLITWVKPQMGLGHYVRNATEVVLFGVRGSLPTLSRSVRGHFTAPRRAHSQKPPEFLDLVQRLSPGPYLEVFSRCLKTKGLQGCTCSQCRLGWEVWGDQSGAICDGFSDGLVTGFGVLCGRCGQPVPKPRRGPRGVWCSPTCRTAAWRERQIVQGTTDSPTRGR